MKMIHLDLRVTTPELETAPTNLSELLTQLSLEDLREMIKVIESTLDTICAELYLRNLEKQTNDDSGTEGLCSDSGDID
jgi:hypothetical protein